MENLIIENKKDKVILKLSKKGFDEDYLIALIKRLKVEELAKKSGFGPEILSLAEDINQEWWVKNGDDFLSEVIK